MFLSTILKEKEENKFISIELSAPQPHRQPLLSPNDMQIHLSWHAPQEITPITVLYSSYQKKFIPEYQRVERFEDGLSILVLYQFHDIYAKTIATTHSKEQIYPYFKFTGCGLDAVRYNIGGNDGVAISLLDEGYFIQFSEEPEFLNTFSKCNQMEIIWPLDWPGGYPLTTEAFQTTTCFDLVWENKRLQSINGPK